MSRRYQTAVGGLVLTGLAVGAVLPLQGAAKVSRQPSAGPGVPIHGSQQAQRCENLFASQPLMFEENRGQAPHGVKYLSRGSGYTVAITPQETIIALRREHAPRTVGNRRDEDANLSYTQSVVRTRLVGAHSAPKVEASGALPARISYFLGNDPSKWRTNIPTSSRVKLSGVYPGVDLVYYGSQQQMEYDFVVAPGADPNKIRLKYEGAEKVELAANGDLVLRTGNGEIRQHKPVIYQEKNGSRIQVAGSFDLKADGVGFKLASYDAARPLVIDPVLAFSTYFGGGSNDRAYGVAVDSSGGTYIVGETLSTAPTPLPTAPPGNTYDTTFNGSGADGGFPGTNRGDAFAAKFNSNGQLVYSTYLGGSAGELAYAVDVDASGNAYLTGFTCGSGYPTTVGAQRTSFAGGYSDAFVTKLNPAGTALSYSTLVGGFGGKNGEDRGRDILVDGSGRAWICGLTGSSAGLGITANAALASKGGDFDGLLCIVNATGTGFDYCSYMGANADDAFYGMARSGNVVYLVGSTKSTNWAPPSYIVVNPTGNPSSSNGGSYSGNVLRGVYDVLLVRMNLSLSGVAQLTNWSYLGGPADDYAWGCALDASGNLYVTGETNSLGFPSTPTAAYKTFQGAENDAFLVKVNSTLTSLSYSTFLGGSGYTKAERVVVDSTNQATIVGRTSAGIPTTNGALKGVPELYDAFITTFNSSGSGLILSTLLGGTGNDYAYDLALDADSNLYVVGETNSSSGFPTVNAYQSSLAGGYDAFIYRRPPSRPPTVGSLANQCVSTTTPKVLSSLVGDPDGDQLLVTWKVNGTTLKTETITGGYPNNATSATSTFTRTYAVGPQTVTVSVTDGVYTVSSSCILTGDNTPPVINGGVALADVLHDNAPGECYYIISPFPVPSVSDDCGTPTISGVRSRGGPGLNGQYDVGETIITWTATDEAGNTAVKTQRVYITDVEPPVINPDPLPTIEVTDSDGDGVEYVDPMSPTFGGPVTATDNCPEMLMFDGYRDNPGDNEPTDPNDDWPLPSGNYPLGVTKITWIAVDSEINVTIAEQLVIVHGTSTISSKFDVAGDSADGWSVTSGATGPTYVTTGGTSNGGGAGDGFIRGTDTSTSTQWYFTAPSKFHGNRQGAYGQSLGFALKQNGGNAGSVTSTTADVILQGGGYTLVASLAPSSAPSSGWSSYSVNFSTAAWVFQGTSTHPSAAQLQQALGSVYNLQIRGKYDTANAVTMDLDNVVLNQSY